MIVDNATLQRNRDIVFANSAAYHVELPMAGREAENELLTNALTSGARQLISIHAPLGAGKTFFLNKVLGAHAAATAGFEELANVKYSLATTIDPGDDSDGEPDDDGELLDAATFREHPLVLERAAGYDQKFQGVDGLHVLIVEELDRKATLGQVVWTTASALAWLDRGDDRLLILTGDATTRNSRFSALLDTVPGRSSISLDPLEIDLLEDALTSRLLDKVVEPAAGADVPEDRRAEIAREAAQQILADELIRLCAVPLTDPSSLATFREALGALRDVCSAAPGSVGALTLDRSLVRSFSRGPMAPTGSAADIETELLTYVRGQIEAGAPLEPLSVEDLAAMVGADAAKDTFRRRTVAAVAQLGLLVPLGVPFEERDGRGNLITHAEPFIPGYPLVHRALGEIASEHG